MHFDLTSLKLFVQVAESKNICLLYTSDAADERSSVDLGGRRIIKKKKKTETMLYRTTRNEKTTTNSDTYRR